MTQLKKKNLRKFFKRKTIAIAWILLMCVCLCALLASVIANDKPLYVKYKGSHLFPAFSVKGFNGEGNERLVYSTTDWKKLEKESVIWPPVNFAPGKSDLANSDYKSPFDKPAMREDGDKISPSAGNRHLLGTTKTGADVLSGIIHGARVSLTIGLLSMIIAGSLGILIGAAAGFFGDYRIRISRGGLISALFFGLPLSWFYGFHLNAFLPPLFLSICFALLVSTICIRITYLAGKYLSQLINQKKYSFLHLDQLISRSIEIFNSIPRIVLIITLSAISRPSIWSLVLIIGFTSWTEVARLVRAEMIRIRNSEFMQSAEASGIKISRQLYRHALPNVLIPALTAITLGVPAAILTESSLSFLGIGVPADVVTWGSLLNEGRQNFSAWWLIAFPGLAIFITVASINLLGDALSEVLDRKNN